MLDYQTHAELLKKLDILVVAASVDSRETATKTIEGLKLTFPIGYGLDAKAISEKIGAYYDAKSLYLHATSFLLKPNSMVFNAVYSSLAIGRFGPQEAASLVEIVRSRKVIKNAG